MIYCKYEIGLDERLLVYAYNTGYLQIIGVKTDPGDELSIISSNLANKTLKCI